MTHFSINPLADRLPTFIVTHLVSSFPMDGETSSAAGESSLRARDVCQRSRRTVNDAMALWTTSTDIEKETSRGGVDGPYYKEKKGGWNEAQSADESIT